MKSFWKPIFHSLTAVTLVSVPSATTMAVQQQAIHVTINGVSQTFDTTPYFRNNRIMVPLRAVAEQLGATVAWNPEMPDFVILTKQQSSVQVEIGSPHIIVNGREMQLAQAPELIHNRVMVPVQMLAQAFGATVAWNPSSHTVAIVAALQKNQVLNLPLETDSFDLDSVTAAESTALTVLSQVDEGLVRLDAHNRAIPGVAKTWDILGDGLTYHFHLRPDAKWSDGSAVTAQDFVYAWKRALEPQTATQEAFQLFGIQGAQDFNAGKVPFDQVGIKAVDAQTLQVVLTHPLPYFTEQMAMPVFFPQKQSFVEQQGSDYGTDVGKLLTDGPFQLTAWTHHQQLTLQKSPTYWDNNNVRLQKVNYQVVQSSDDLTKLYEAGKLDRITLQGDDVARYQTSAEFGRVSQPITGYLDFNEKDPVLQNPKIRKALTYALDPVQLAQLAQVRYGGSVVGATGFVPSGVADGHSGDFRQDNGDIIDRQDNAVKAKALLQQGLKEAGLTAFPTIKLTMDDLDASKRLGDFMQQQWKEKLGIDVQIDYVPFKLVISRWQNHDYDMLLNQWGADYNDPMTFLDLFNSDNPFDESGYHNPAYDNLIAQAKQELDAVKRMQLLSSAEQMLISDDMACAPLFFRGTAYVRKSYVKNWVDHSFGAEYDLKETYLDGQ